MLLILAVFVLPAVCGVTARADTLVASGGDGKLTWEVTQTGTDAEGEPQYKLKVTKPSTSGGFMPDWSNSSPPPWKAYLQNVTEVYVGEGFHHIGNFAFRGSPSKGGKLQTVTIDTFGKGSPGEIGEYAFAFQPNLTSLDIGDNLYGIKAYAFQGDTGLKKVVISQNIMVYLEEGVFKDCSGLENIAINCNNIGTLAFQNCTSLRELTLSAQGNVGLNAFDNCPAITTVRYTHTRSWWDQINFKAGNEDLTGATIVCEPETVWIHNGTFPDPVLRRKIKPYDNIYQNGALEKAERDAIKSLDLSGENLKNGTGINLLTALTELHINNIDSTASSVKELDLSGLSKLRQLQIVSQTFTKVNISGCPLLVTAVLYGEQQVSSPLVAYGKGSSMLLMLNGKQDTVILGETATFLKSSALRTACKAYLDDDDLLSIKEILSITDISIPDGDPSVTALNGIMYLTRLKTLTVHGTGIKRLDLNMNTRLTSVDVSRNKLTSLNLPGSDSLAKLRCYGNDLSAVSISNNPLLCAAGETAPVQKKDGTISYLLYSAGGNTLAVDQDTVVMQPPVITAQPKDVTVTLGEKATFTVEARGGDLQYQWYYRTYPGGPWSAVKAASGKTASYSLTTAERHNGYQYYCKLTDADGTSETRAVTLKVKPKITTQPKAQTVTIGNKVTFTVAAEGKDLEYLWFYRTGEDAVWKNVTAASGSTASYTLTTAQRHDGYQYHCRVKSGSVYTNSKTVTLKVKPKFTTQPKGVTVTLGQDASFTAKANGAKRYQWYYRTSSSGSWKAISAASGKTETYTLTTAERHNGYQYRCKATINSSYAYSSTVTLKVLPKITTQPKAQTVTAGKQVTFTVAAKGKTPLSYQWYYKKNADAEWKEITAASGKTAAYTLTTEARHNGYQYRCRVTSGSVYSVSKAVTLTVK